MEAMTVASHGGHVERAPADMYRPDNRKSMSCMRRLRVCQTQKPEVLTSSIDVDSITHIVASVAGSLAVRIASRRAVARLSNRLLNPRSLFASPRSAPRLSGLEVRMSPLGVLWLTT